jgi:hypothetical protein
MKHFTNMSQKSNQLRINLESIPLPNHFNTNIYLPDTVSSNGRYLRNQINITKIKQDEYLCNKISLNQIKI